MARKARKSGWDIQLNIAYTAEEPHQTIDQWACLRYSRSGDCRRTGATIGIGVRARVWQAQPFPNDPFRRGVSRRQIVSALLTQLDWTHFKPLIPINHHREEDNLSHNLVFRDPQLLDFRGIKDSQAEKDLEAATLRQIKSFILDLGIGLAFLERQKWIIVDEIDHYLDLLFYHRNIIGWWPQS